MSATVEEIKSAITRCKTHAELTTTAQHFATDIAAMYRAGGESRTMAIQIRNLGKYQRMLLREDQ
jgi:hypothetical protein